jgi:hypothetical protein
VADSLHQPPGAAELGARSTVRRSRDLSESPNVPTVAGRGPGRAARGLRGLLLLLRSAVHVAAAIGDQTCSDPHHRRGDLIAVDYGPVPKWALKEHHTP